MIRLMGQWKFRALDHLCAGNRIKRAMWRMYRQTVIRRITRGRKSQTLPIRRKTRRQTVGRRAGTVSFRLEDPGLEDGTPGFGLDETKIFIHNTTPSSSIAANISTYGLEIVKDTDSVFHVTSDILPVNTEFSISARDLAVNTDFTDSFTGPNIKQNKGFVIDKIDSEAPRAENVSQSPAADVWSREKLISADVRDIAMEMDWDAAIDDDGNFYSYPVPAEDGETGGSGIDEVFLSEDKNAGPNDQGNIPVSSALFLDTDGAHAISTTVNHNGTYYLIMTDKVGNRAEVPIVVTTIDTKLPVVMDVTHTPATTENRLPE